MYINVLPADQDEINILSSLVEREKFNDDNDDDTLQNVAATCHKVRKEGMRK